MFFLILLFVFFVPIYAWSMWTLLRRIPRMSKSKKITSFVKSVFVIIEEGVVLSILLNKAKEEVSTDPDGFPAMYIKVLAAVEFTCDTTYWVPMAFGAWDEWFEGTRGPASFMKSMWKYSYDSRLDPDWLTYIFALNSLGALATFFSVPIVIRSDECGNDIGANIWIVGLLIMCAISIGLWVAGCCCDIMPKLISFLQKHTAKVLMIGKFVMVTVPVDISIFACSWEFPVIVTSSFLGQLFDYLLECGDNEYEDANAGGENEDTNAEDEDVVHPSDEENVSVKENEKEEANVGGRDEQNADGKQEDDKAEEDDYFPVVLPKFTVVTD